MDEPEIGRSIGDVRVAARRDDICIHIFTTSATLVGVCLTVIGLLRLIQQFNNAVVTIADEALTLNAVGFLTSCTLAYGAMRSSHAARRRRLEQAADVVFLVALGVMVLVCGVIAYELI